MTDDSSRKDEQNKPEKSGLPQVSVPNLSEVKSSFKSSIKSAVQHTNEILAGLEETSDKITKPAMENYRHLEKKSENALKQAGHYYDRRKQYGPHLVIGSALLVGGFVGLRRGRVPAVATGAVTGFVTYLGVYEIELHHLPDIIFGKQE
jgi:hypothetical protein